MKKILPILLISLSSQAFAKTVVCTVTKSRIMGAEVGDKIEFTQNYSMVRINDNPKTDSACRFSSANVLECSEDVFVFNKNKTSAQIPGIADLECK